MLPKADLVDLEANDGLDFDFEIEEQPSYTWGIDFKNNRIYGNIDYKKALEQAIYLILQTERYVWLIHSFAYGCEVNTLIGKDINYAIPEIERYIKEALLQDDRINSVHSFEFEVKGRNNVICAFTVDHIYGESRIIDRREL